MGSVEGILNPKPETPTRSLENCKFGVLGRWVRPAYVWATLRIVMGFLLGFEVVSPSTRVVLQAFRAGDV